MTAKLLFLVTALLFCSNAIAQDLSLLTVGFSPAALAAPATTDVDKSFDLNEWTQLAQKLIRCGMALETNIKTQEDGALTLDLSLIIKKGADIEKALKTLKESVTLPDGLGTEFAEYCRAVHKTFGEDQIRLDLSLTIPAKGDWSINRYHLTLGTIEPTESMKSKYCLEMSEKVAQELVSWFVQEEMALQRAPIIFPISDGEIKARGLVFINNLLPSFTDNGLSINLDAKVTAQFLDELKGFNASLAIKDTNCALPLELIEMSQAEEIELEKLSNMPDGDFDLRSLRRLKELRSRYQARIKLAGRFSGKHEIDLSDFVNLGSFEQMVKNALRQSLVEQFGNITKRLNGTELAKYVHIDGQLDFGKLTIKDDGSFTFDVKPVEVDLSETLRLYVPIKSPLSLDRFEVTEGRMTLSLDIKR